MVQRPLGKKKAGKSATQRVNKPKQGKAKSVAEKIMHVIGGRCWENVFAFLRSAQEFPH